MERLSVEFAAYKKEIEKHNLFLSDFDKLDDSYTITMTENKYAKLGRKNFPTKATETETTEITARQYACYMTSVGFFGDRVTNSYTTAGYKPTRIVCTSPDRELKIERSFGFEMN